MNMKAMLGAVVALLLAVGGTAFLAARVATPKPLPPPPVPAEIADQLKVNPFDLLAPGPKSKVVAEETRLDFGVMALGGEMSHDFLFKNEGEGPLRLAKGPMMCKCTMPAVPDQEIKPGESINIKLTWKPVEMSTEFSKEAVIWTNDPAKPKVVLLIKGQVFSDPGVFPNMFTLGDIPWDKERENEVTLVSGIENDLKVEGVEVSHPEWMTVTLEPLDVEKLVGSGMSNPKPRSGYAVKLKISPHEKVGPFSGWIKLKLNHGLAEQRIDVVGSRSGPILIHGPHYQAELSMVDLKRFKSAEGNETKMFMFLVPFGEDMRIDEISSTSKSLTATLTKESPAGAEKDRYVLVIKALPGATPGTTYTIATPNTLTLKTNHPHVPELTFKVRYIVQ